MAQGGNIIGQAMIEVLPLTSGFQQNLNQQLQRAHSSQRISIPITGNAKPLEDAVTHAITGLAKKALLIVGVGSIFGLVVRHLKDAIYGFNNVIQQAQIGLETILKDSQAAADLIDKLKVFARTTPFQFADLVKNTQTLVAMGTAAEDVIPTLTAVGNTLAALGRMSQLPRVIYDLGQIRATGRLTGRELMNMAMQGIPVLKYLAEATGKSMEEIREQMALGVRSARGMMIDSETAINAIMVGMNKDFGGLMVAQMGTAQGAISNWKDAEEQLIAAVGKPLFDVLIKQTIGLSTVLSNMAAAFSEAGKKGENALGAVKEIFLDLFPPAAQATISAVLTNLQKLLTDFGKIVKAVVIELKTWAATIGGILLVGLQGMLAVLRPVGDYLAKHKEIVQDLVKVYVALKVIQVVTAMWVKMNAVLDVAIAKTIAFGGATKATTAAVALQATALEKRQAAAYISAVLLTGGAAMTGNPSQFYAGAAQDLQPAVKRGILRRMGGVLAPRMPGGAMTPKITMPTGPSSFNDYSEAAVTNAGVAAEKATGRFAGLGRSLLNMRTAAVGSTLILEGLKTTVLEGNKGLTGMATAAQSVAIGFAVGGPLGGALGAIVGMLMLVKDASGATAKAIKELRDAVDEVANADWATYKAHLKSIHGDSASVAGTNVLDIKKVTADNIVAHDASVAALEQYQKDHPMPGSSGWKDRVMHAASKLPGAKEGPEDLDPEQDPEFIWLAAEEERLRRNIEQGKIDISLAGEYGAILQHYIDIYTGPALLPPPPDALQGQVDSFTRRFGLNTVDPYGMGPSVSAVGEDPWGLGRAAMKDLGQTKADQDILYKETPAGKGTGAPLTLQELEDTTGGVEALMRQQDMLNEHNIGNYDELIKYASGIAKIEYEIEKAIKAGEDWAKSQKIQFQIDHDVADSNQALIDTFRGVVNTIEEGNVSIEDFVAAGKGLGDNIEQTGKAVYESMMAQQQGATQASVGALNAQKDIIDSFIELELSAGRSNAEINTTLEQLGLLDFYKTITLQIDADTTAAWEALNTLLAALEATHNGFAAADAGSLMGLAGGNTFDPFKGPAKVPGKDTPYPTGGGKKGGGGGSTKDPAEEAAKALESASKAFYSTIVSAAESFHEKVVDLMGNPAERIQYAQARSAAALTRNTDMRAAALTDWTTGIAKLKTQGLSQMAVDALGLMEGPEMGKQVKRLLQASSADILKLNASITAESEAAQKSAYAMQGDTIAKAITLALAKFFADAGTTPGGPGAIEITNNITQAVVDYDALALRIITQLGGTVKIN